MKLIIQIPCYNEASTLALAIADLPKEIEGIDCIEYLIINDGSMDDTEAVARQCGVHHIVSFAKHKGLAKGFMAGLDECLRQGADIIVNTDADCQYCAQDIEKIVLPILKKEADYVIGARPIDDTPHFSLLKKKMQHLGSFVVRMASGTDIPDAPSGFRALSRECAMHINVVNDYTYTLETIVQAGRDKMAITSVPIHTNEEIRPSRLFKSMWGYVKKSIVTILRSYIMYYPLKCFTYLALIPFLIGFAIAVRYIVFYCMGQGSGHIQSLILACTLMIMGFVTFMIGLVGDVIAANRRLLQDTQYHVRQINYDFVQKMQKNETMEVDSNETN